MRVKGTEWGAPSRGPEDLKLEELRWFEWTQPLKEVLRETGGGWGHTERGWGTGVPRRGQGPGRHEGTRTRGSVAVGGEEAAHRGQ